jgi:polyvinyl alcohol dehydrogenase (cytochrome)
MAAGNGQPSWTSWGGDLANLRFQPAEKAGLAGGDAKNLKLKWAFAVPDATSLRSQPAVYGSRVIFGGGDTLYSLDAATGCTYWAAEMPAPIQSGISIGSSTGMPVAFLGDQSGNVHAIDFATGMPVWQMNADPHPSARVTGTPVYYKERLYVPVSSFEEVEAAAPGYVCCTFRGSVLAVDSRTGKSIWRTSTVDEPAERVHLTKGGAKRIGPSGAGIWSSPTIDSEAGVLYVTTGDNYSDPPTDKSDALLALSLQTGKLLWSKQFRAGDPWNVACMDPNNTNCPDAGGPDYDFGSPAILTSLPTGRRVLVLSQKSGAVYGVDPANHGELIWQTQIGKGGVLGGIEWGAASDSEKLYVALSDEAFLTPAHPGDPPFPDPEKGGGLFALKLNNGERLWMTPPPPCGARRSCSPGQPGAVTVVPGVVFSGSLDGHVRGYSSFDGKVLWDYDMARDYKTVNGVPGRGGSLSVAGPIIVDGTLYAVSGYDLFGGAPGNVLLAFTVDGR